MGGTDFVIIMLVVCGGYDDCGRMYEKLTMFFTVMLKTVEMLYDLQKHMEIMC